MIYADEYQKIRRATPDDANAIYHISMVSARTQNLVYRPLGEIRENISSYFVYELDSSIIAIVSLLDLGEGAAELACTSSRFTRATTWARAWRSS